MLKNLSKKFLGQDSGYPANRQTTKTENITPFAEVKKKKNRFTGFCFFFHHLIFFNNLPIIPNSCFYKSGVQWWVWIVVSLSAMSVSTSVSLLSASSERQMSWPPCTPPDPWASSVFACFGTFSVPCWCNKLSVFFTRLKLLWTGRHCCGCQSDLAKLFV